MIEQLYMNPATFTIQQTTSLPVIKISWSIRKYIKFTK